MFRRETRVMKIVTSIDDQGWIFPSRESKSSIEPDKTEPEYFPSNLGNGVKAYYQGFFFNIKKEKVYKRSFMKIQTLSAVVGGMMKSVFGVFAFAAVMRALRERDEKLRDQFFNIKFRGEENNSKLSIQNETSNVNTVVRLKVPDQKSEPKLSCWASLLRYCCLQTEKNGGSKVMEQLRSYMNTKLDVTYLIKVFEQFTEIKEMLLTDDQKEFLENYKTKIEVEA